MNDKKSRIGVRPGFRESAADGQTVPSERIWADMGEPERAGDLQLAKLLLLVGDDAARMHEIVCLMDQILAKRQRRTRRRSAKSTRTY